MHIGLERAVTVVLTPVLVVMATVVFRRDVATQVPITPPATPMYEPQWGDRASAGRRVGSPRPSHVLAFVRKLSAEARGESNQAQSATAVAPSRQIVDGIRILRHDARAQARAPQLTVDTVVLTSAGGLEQPDTNDLTHASSVAVLSGNRIATLAPFETRLLVHESTGVAKSVLRRGRGPREVWGAVNMVQGRGDTLLVPDIGNARIHWITTDQGIVRSESLLDRLPPLSPNVAGMLSDGRMVFFSSGYGQKGVLDRVTRSAAAVVVLPQDSAGVAIASIPDMDLLAVNTRYEGRRNVETFALGFSRRGHVAVLDAMIVTTAAEGYRIDLRNPAGSVMASLLVDVAPRRVTRAMREAHIGGRLRQLAESRERPRDPTESQRLVREMPFAECLPFYSALHVAPNRLLWVVDAIAPGDSHWSASAFRSDGALVGRVVAQLSAGTPVAFGVGQVVLRSTDADGVVTLALRRIIPATATRQNGRWPDAGAPAAARAR
jgi:hypothetical protein